MEAALGKKSGVVVPEQPGLRQRLGGAAVYAFVRAIAFTLRCRWTDRSGFFIEPKPGGAIFAVPHSRLFLALVSYNGYARKRNTTPGMAALISASRDGGFLTGIFRHFGVQAVRGSSSRRGPQALRELTTWARRGYDIGITPDGPRGPAGVVQEGVIAIAQLTGLPIIPLSYELGWKIRLNSWDRFQIPLPFSRCEMFYGEPVYVPRDATPEQREILRLQLEKSMHSVSRF